MIITDGIIKKLKAAYPDCEFYEEKVEQNLNPPCFSILCLNQSGESTIEYRGKRTYHYMIQYFPSSENTYNECLEVADKLSLLLNDIELEGNGYIHNDRTNSVITDDTLNCDTTFEVFILNKPDEVNMEELTFNEEVEE